MGQTSNLPLTLIPALIYVFVMYPLAILIALVVGDFRINLTPVAVVALVVQAVVIGYFMLFTFKMNKHVDATQYILITNLYTPVTVAIGVFFLREPFTSQQGLGTVLLIIGVILVATKSFDRKIFNLDEHSIKLACLALIFGVGLAAEKVALNHMSVYSYMIVGWGMQFALNAFWSRKYWHLIPKIDFKVWKDLIKIGVVRTGSAFTYVYALSASNNLPLVASMTTFRVPLVFVFSYFLLREKDHLIRRVFGVGVATIGLLLL